MRLAEIMTQPVQSIDAEAGIREAATRMKEAGVGMLPVMSGQRCIGVVTDRDLVIRALSVDGIDRRIREVMTPEPVCMDKEADVDDAIKMMEEEQVGRIVVTDGGGQPIGVVSAGAIALACRGNPQVASLAYDLSAAHSNYAS